MSVTPRGGFIAPSLLGTSREESLAVARRHRLELLTSIHEFERAIAVPSADPDWRRQVAQRLAQLREAFAEHIAVTEGEDGLYAELLIAAPRLARAVGVLVREHAMIARALDRYASRLGGPDVAVEQLRGWASDLLRELSRHRQRGADLVYEAYATDIGGET
ncbi:MAG: hemerythrin domain-containing protein [Micromonosporaceae bacterium]